jgi:hypothetical protein
VEQRGFAGSEQHVQDSHILVLKNGTPAIVGANWRLVRSTNFANYRSYSGGRRGHIAKLQPHSPQAPATPFFDLWPFLLIGISTIDLAYQSSFPSIMLSIVLI